MEESQNQAKETIALAAADALKLISNASDLQLKTIANAASEALKVTNIKSADDHDVLITLKAEVSMGMRDIRADIKELNDGVTITITDHEKRLRITETNITKIITVGSVLIVLLGIIEFLVNKFVR